MNSHLNPKPYVAHDSVRVGSRSPWPLDRGMAVRIGGFAVLK